MTDKNYPSGQPTVQALSRSDSRGKILQWHPGFCAALQIELKEEAEFLEFYPEYELSKKPMRIDTLIVKKIEDRPVKKNIGRIFRKYNLIEYKSPEDYLSINDFYKVYGYACFYQSDTEKIHEIRMSEITISFVCSHYPREMLRSLREERGIEAEKTADGIYCLKNDVIPIQMILSHELPREENRWLASLRKDLKADEETNRLLEDYRKHKESRLYRAAMDLITRANQKTMEEARKMCDALRELYAEDLKRDVEREVQKEVEKEVKRVKKEMAVEVEKEVQKEEKRLFALIGKLLREDRIDDIRKVSEDKTYRDMMYRQYGL